MSLASKKFNIVKIILNKSIFDENIIYIILNYYWQLLDNKHKVLLNWIDKNKIKWMYLSSNPNAIDLLKIRIEYEIEYENSLSSENYFFNTFCWRNLSANPNAIELLTNNQDKIIWITLSRNPNAIDLLKENENMIDWDFLASNPNAIDLLKKNKNNINWNELSKNPSIFKAVLYN